MTPAAVIDASVAVSLIIPGQATAATASFALERWSCIAPAILKVEVRHALRRLERRGLLPETRADLDLIAFEAEVSFIDPLSDSEIDDVMFAARKLNLGFYDACYVHLAIGARAALISRDGPMISAAQFAGLTVFDLR